MSAAANIAEPACQPDPPQDPAPASVAPTRIAHLLGVVTALIAFGKQLAATLQAHTAAEAPNDIALRFGINSAAFILARITRGLQLAAALETKLAERASRPEAARTPCAPSFPRKPRSPRPKAPPLPDTDPAILPTAEEIAEKLRRHPAHVLLREICSDLGLLPSDPLYRRVEEAIWDYNGDTFALWKDTRKRTAITNFIPPNVRFVWPKLRQTWEPFVPSVAVVATGPP